MRLVSAAIFTAFFVVPAIAHAGDERAREAYDRGVRAHAAGREQEAALAFAEADAIDPSPAALEAALEASMRADDAVLGTELLDRAAGRPADKGVARSVDAAKKRFTGRVGQIRAECNQMAPCMMSIDGAGTDASKAIYVKVGTHDVTVQRGEERVQRLVQVAANRVVVVGGADPGPVVQDPVVVGPTPIAASPTPGVSRTYFYIAAGLTVAAGVFTIASGIDTSSKHSDFDDAGCATGTGRVPLECGTKRNEGENAQTRTNILLGTTLVLAAATAAIGIFAVRWKDGTTARFGPGYATLTFR